MHHKNSPKTHKEKEKGVEEKQTTKPGSPDKLVELMILYGRSFETAYRSAGNSPETGRRLSVSEEEALFNKLSQFVDSILPDEEKIRSEETIDLGYSSEEERPRSPMSNASESLKISIDDGMTRPENSRLRHERYYSDFHAVAIDFQNYVAKMDEEEFKQFCKSFVNPSIVKKNHAEIKKLGTAALIVYLFLSENDKDHDINIKRLKSVKDIYFFCQETLNNLQRKSPRFG